MSEYTPTIISPGGPAPTPPAPAITLRFLNSATSGTERAFSSDFVTIGRAGDNDLSFDSATGAKVSGHHARLLCDRGSGAWSIEDLRSTNGTFINGYRIVAAQQLNTGDVIVLGDPSDQASLALQVAIAGQLPAMHPPTAEATLSEPKTYIPPPAAPGAEQEGFFGRMKGKWSRWQERRELQKQLEQGQADLVAMKQRHVTVYTTLGAQIVDEKHVHRDGLASLPAADSVRRALSSIDGLGEQIEAVHAQTRASNAELAGWMNDWQGRADTASAALDSATGRRDAARTENAEADAALRELLRPRLQMMRDTASKLTQTAGQIESVPESATQQQIADLGWQVGETAGQISQPLDELPATIERLMHSRTDLADAEMSLTAAQAASVAVATERTERDRAHATVLQQHQQQIAGFEGQIGQQRMFIQQQHAALGEQANDAFAGGLASIDGQPAQAAVAALRERQAQEAKIADLTRRVEELSQ